MAEFKGGGDVSPTLTCESGAIVRIEVMEDKQKEPKCLGGIGDKWGDKQYRQGNRVYDSEHVGMALGAGHIGNLGGDSYLYLVKKQRFFQQAIETLEQNECQPGDVINAYNKTVDKSGCSPTIITRPEAFKTAILPVVREDKKNMEEEKTEEVQEEKKTKYAIRKLTPLECYRLMNFSDEDFFKAQNVISNSQLYKTAGNSIVCAVLCAIFSQLGIQGHKRWNEMTVEERRSLAYKGTILEAK